MENLKGHYLENIYSTLTPLKSTESCRTYLVKNSVDDSLAVKKEISSLQFPIYQQLQQLTHPNLAQILDTYSLNGHYFVLEEYISGTSLQNRLRNGYSFAESEMTAIISQLCDVLALLHSHHIIHRDITPDNILISSDSVVKLVDFGISRTKKTSQTQDTTILGTVGYAAPEQFGFGQTDERTDIYALGVLINVLLTGSLPSEQLTSHRYYRHIIQKCISIDPSDRYTSIDELASRLHGLKKNISPSYLSSSGSVFLKILHQIPGFRSGSVWKLSAALISYFILGVMGHSAAFGTLSPETTRLESWTVVIFFFFVPWGIYVDIGHFSKHMKLFRNKTFISRLIIRTGMVLISVIICAMLILLEEALF